ncbi:uncharacterized protein BXZ73DRAFT_55601 [Epithele typhae]|uniref:uncharacterized protein n=1 Tax=Epithele typhae TaxID=378194 RepID=UPI002007CFB7|nr:uncharacterized protein BXZ73DRAFT_55601 [Epithele typhae]KAH9913123.1 hypothetical protein BXZ73DRAFT_55601 [Epithele typhae]
MAVLERLEPGTLRHLEDDILLQIIDELHSPLTDLASLAQTCVWVRSLCLPTLFRDVKASSKDLIQSPSSFIPDHLWPYVRTLFLHGPFRRFRPHSGYKGYYGDVVGSEHIQDASSHEWRVADFLAIALRSIPRLNAVIIGIPNMLPNGIDGEKIGVPPKVIESILRIPQLRHFEVIGSLYHPYDPPYWDCPTIVATLTTFKSKPLPLRQNSRSNEREATLLRLLVPQLRSRIRVLHLPMEAVPFSELSQHNWPCLRELVIEGMHYQGGPRPTFILVLALMPELRLLHLRVVRSLLTIGVNTRDRIIWPEDVSAGAMPWPFLEDLVVTQPQPDDQIWAHLPSTLHTLRLRTWPHPHSIDALNPGIYKHGRNDLLRWSMYVPVDEHVLRIIRACAATGISTLELEYIITGDGNVEDALLCEVAERFPRLERLTIYRYDDTVDYEGHDNTPEPPRPLVCPQSLSCVYLSS